MILKPIRLATLYFALLLIPENGTAQESAKPQKINGIVRSKTSTIYFEDFGFENNRFKGDIRSNISGSKYIFHLKNGQEELEGEIIDKLSKFSVDLKYKGNKIQGQINRSTNHTKDKWDIHVFEHNLSGTVVHNAMKTVDTYNLGYDNRKITGTIHKKMNTLVYDLLFDKKKISGTMSYNASTVKHTYNLKAEELAEDEFIVFLFIESIKLMNERIAEIDDFQGNE